MEVKVPTCWNDKTLIEDHNSLLLDEFSVRKFYVSTSRSSSRKDPWMARLTQQIQRKPSDRAAALKWVDLAFKPDHRVRKPPFAQEPKAELLAIELFVRFYWNWYDEGDSAAERVLRAERKKRGYGYGFPDNETGVQQPAGHEAPYVHMDAETASDASEAWRHVSDGGGQNPNTLVPSVHADPVAVEDDVDVNDGAVVTDGGDSDSVLVMVGGEDEKDEMVTFLADDDVADYIDSASNPGQSPMSCSQDLITQDGPLNVVAAGPPPEGGSSTAVEEAAELAAADSGATASVEAPLPISQPVTQRRRKLRGGAPAGPLRRGVPRSASNREKLSAIARVESVPFHTEKHELVDTAVDSPETMNKRQKTAAPSTTPAEPATLPSNSSTAFTPHDAAIAETSTRAPRKRGRPPGSGKKTGPKSTLRGAGRTNVEQRPAKRQKPNAIHALRQSINHLIWQQKKYYSDMILPEEVHDQDGEDNAMEQDTPTRPVSRKRGLDSHTNNEDVTASSPSEPRKIAKLPKTSSGRSFRVRLKDFFVPRPKPSTLGCPADLPEADRMLRDSATEASLELADQTPQAGEWPQDDGVQDAPPESDDEEDIPLSVLCAKRTNESSPSIPDDADMPNPKPVVPPVVKRPLTIQPVIWAKSRQEVCESLDWFRSYQGGVYFNNDIAKGYLLGGFSASRDLFAHDGRLIISHGGGRAESVHSEKGKLVTIEASDQLDNDKSVRALLGTASTQRPIALLIDDRYSLFPYDLTSKKDCTYAALGFYHIAYAWAERQTTDNGTGSVVRYKFAFRWCKKQPEPWWTDQDASTTTECTDTSSYSASVEYTCSTCKEVSPLVYQEGWMCLKPRCKAFWILMDGSTPSESLTYADSFINSTVCCDHEPLQDIAPRPPASEATDGVVTSRRFARGWHCKLCGRLSCRFKWQHWECQNCGNTISISGKMREPNEFWSQTNEKFYHFENYEPTITASPLRQARTTTGFVSYHVFTLPQNRGNIYMILGSRLQNGIPDEIFRQYQEQAKSGQLQFCRFPLKAHQCRGEFLTNYFSQNSGEPYKYVGGTANTVPWESAPSAVVKAREFIQSRMMTVMAAESEPYQFNEVLSAGYMEEQSMSFHSDAEKGLGPRVASLSLGSAAYMHFRLLRKYRDEHPQIKTQRSLTLFLRHGDVVIMDGADIQKYYQHTVIPLNFRIAATARYIGPNSN